MGCTWVPPTCSQLSQGGGYSYRKRVKARLAGQGHATRLQGGHRVARHTPARRRAEHRRHAARRAFQVGDRHRNMRDATAGAPCWKSMQASTCGRPCPPAAHTCETPSPAPPGAIPCGQRPTRASSRTAAASLRLPQQCAAAAAVGGHMPYATPCSVGVGGGQLLASRSAPAGVQTTGAAGPASCSCSPSSCGLPAATGPTPTAAAAPPGPPAPVGLARGGLLLPSLSDSGDSGDLR